MARKFRKHPLVCLLISIARLITGKLKLSNLFLNETVEMDDGSRYQVFRHITNRNSDFNSKQTIFIVSFKFSHLSHKANQKASIIPMLLITGFPGFVKKIYAVNPQNGYWQGMYEWESLEALEEYKTCFVFKMMNKRTIPESIQSVQFENQSLDTFIKDKMVKA